ncbi:hypothetical protein MR857_14330 [bacterium]|nr:hypothetical protein [bacterium]MDY3020613.1 hypothetical protein [Oliverpabstia sp.]
MKRRVVSLFLTTTMLAMTVLSGCGKGSTAASDGSADGNLEDFYEITYTGYWSDDTYEDESYVENMLEDALNIELEVVTTDNSNLDSLLATGQMPDCMWCDKEVAFMQDQELIRNIPVSMVKEYAPSFIKYFDENLLLYDYVLDPENPEEFTCLRGITLQFVDYYLPNDYYRYDWIQNLGIDLGVEVEQVADRVYAASDGIELSKFIEIMDAFVNQDPDGDGQKNTYGVTAPNLQQSVFYSAYGFHNGVNEVNGEAEQYYVMDEFKEYLKGFAEIYKNGLIDPEIIEDNRKLSWDKVNTGKAGYWITSTNSLNSWASDRPPLTLLSADPEATILLTPGIKPDGGKVQTVTNSSPAYGYFYVNANVDDEKLARILQFVEYAIFGNGDDSFKASLFYGEEGVDWEWGEDGKPVKINTLASGEKGTWTFSQHGQDEKVTQWTGEEEVFAAGGKYWSANQDGIWMKWQGVQYKEDIANETDFAAIKTEVNTDIEAYVKNYIAQAVLGQIDVDATWNDYLEELDRLGYNEMMSELDKVEPLEDMIAGK